MKYGEKTNIPLVCIMTQSACYRHTTRMKPLGVLWHSTGVNNPNLKRYVQPSDKAQDRAELLKKLGENTRRNDWNHTEIQAGVNAWVGKLADGTVAAVQTLPWTYAPWGCGGSCNGTHIQFEICEDGLGDRAYFEKCYKEAVELTAYLCKLYSIDPKGTVKVNGTRCPTILDHSESHKLGLGTNHADIMHWFRRYGKTMQNVRNDVAALLADGKRGTKSAVHDSAAETAGTEQKHTPETPAEATLYRVQCGAFGTRENAQKRVDRLKAAGFDAVIMEA